MSCCFLLADGEESVMIDTGLVGEPLLVRRQLRRLGLRPQSIRAILMTHGHLDHAGNLARLKLWTGATIYAHRAEQLHVDGCYPYRGINRWCGRLEAAGRLLTNYRRADIDEFVDDGRELPFWGGLRVVHLPGHTAGHCGYYSSRHNLLFSGDMFASYFFSVHRPAAILNSLPGKLTSSAERIRHLAPRYIVPCHLDVLDGELHRRRFAKLYGLDDWAA
jgi:glyoxylase-like metal-dependent hydrolase (beta-lactamase superfamily II)